ncbi:RCC1 domain-containing protein [Acetivibrio cellulolyticus]|uniref:RCC1 domain-containing protein n=1 Tax=Acetivibrio cellulolyticus TaxID=35830 RepID=UPI0001E3050F|nr:regulator of chromosome condensation RCC1 [Acetivibrio cellulolyticus]
MRKVHGFVMFLVIFTFLCSSCSSNKLNIVSVFCADQSTYLIDKGGKVITFDQSLNGNAGDINRPGFINDLNGIKSIAASKTSVLALKGNGSVFVWGSNYNGIYGSLSIKESQKPVKIESLKDITNVSINESQALAVDKEGNLYNWGVGIEEITKRTELKNVKKAVCGGWHYLALLDNGDVYVWGTNPAGQFGNGKYSSEETSKPQKIDSLKDIVDIDASTEHSIALDKSGNVYTWGGNSEDQLGYATQIEYSNEIKKVSGLSSIKKVYAGPSNSYALDSDGTLWAWGNNIRGQIGIGSESSEVKLPVKVEIEEVKDFSCGFEHCIAVKKDGSVWAWGDIKYSKISIDAKGREFISKPEKVDLDNLIK